MNTFSDSAATAFALIAGRDPMLLSIVARSFAGCSLLLADSLFLCIQRLAARLPALAPSLH